MEKSFATQMSLRPLTSRDRLRVVHSVADARRLPEPLARQIVEKAEGNPFFLQELARAVGDRTDDSLTLSMPDTVQGVLQARIDRLADPPKRLLQTACVIGREVPLKLLRAVWETPGSLDARSAAPVSNVPHSSPNLQRGAGVRGAFPLSIVYLTTPAL
jgi:predicted ATPase